MRRLPGSVSRRRLVRFLVKHGFRLHREGANHSIYVQGERVAVVPRHATLSIGVVHATLKGAKIPREEWDDL